MTISVASFRQDLPEFKSIPDYPNNVIQYWITVGSLLFGMGTGAAPTVCSFEGSVAVDDETLNSGLLTVASISFGSMSLLPLALTYNNSPVGAAITSQVSGPQGGPGQYMVNFEANVPEQAMVALGAGVAGAGNRYWGSGSAVAVSPPTTIADFALEIWVAHQVVLEKQAIAAAAAGGDPGTKVGIISNKSVNGVSVGFDVGAVTGGNMQENAGYYNQTIYGQRFYRLMKLRGAGPIQLGIGRAPPFLFFNSWGLTGSWNAWGGPYPGIEPSDVGFG